MLQLNSILLERRAADDRSEVSIQQELIETARWESMQLACEAGILSENLTKLAAYRAQASASVAASTDTPAELALVQCWTVAVNSMQSALATCW